MDYRFKYSPQAYDLWRLSIYGVYSSMAGMANIIFIVAMVILTMKFWSASTILIKILLLLGVSLFTVIQPLIIYSRAKRQVEALPEGMYIGFDKKGIHIELPSKTNLIVWKKILAIKKMKTMLILYSSSNEGYILTDKILGENKSDFIEYLNNQMKKYIK